MPEYPPETAAPHLLSPYSDNGHDIDTGRDLDQSNDGEASDADHSGFFPSPYSQHGHDAPADETASPAPRNLTISPRPESQFYEPIAVQPAQFFIRDLEASVAGSRPGTPASLSMASRAPPGLHEPPS